jgi:uncharacterized protein (TIGR02246 family)
VDKDKKLGKPSSSSQDSENASAQSLTDVHNPALGEIYQRLYPEIRTHRPRQEAIRAALKAMKQLSPEIDAEQSAEPAAIEATELETRSCPICGHHNREGNRFCSKCGAPVESELATPEVFANREAGAAESMHEPFPGPGSSASGVHHYHHHYHHHYFSDGQVSDSAPLRNVHESARGADKLRVAAAAKGEPMSRSEAAVRRLTQEWVLACNTRQLDELLELYASDAIVLRSNHPPIRGASSVREFFFSALEAGLGEVEVDPIRVDVIGDLAHEVGRYGALAPGTVGKRREERGKYLWVFAKQSDGQWKLVSDCWSADLTLGVVESDIPKPAAAPISKSISPRKGG